MSTDKRNLRSRTASAAPISPVVHHPSVEFNPQTTSTPSSRRIKIISPGSKLPGLTAKESNLLRQKQKQLARNASATAQTLGQSNANDRILQNALEASLVFAQYEAGSAVCVAPDGWILTCAHCFGDTEDERVASNKQRWLLTYTGLAVQTELQAWDANRDLALLKIIAVESSSSGGQDDVCCYCSFRHVRLSTSPPPVNTTVLCIGQPGADDLESETARKTAYNLLEVSRGKFRGMLPATDPHDNAEIGALMHDAWTYWGHSGAPLLRKDDGSLVGLHSSWDDQTGMRHGVPLVAIRHFVQRHAGLIGFPVGVIDDDQVELETSKTVIVIDDDDD